MCLGPASAYLARDPRRSSATVLHGLDRLHAIGFTNSTRRLSPLSTLAMPSRTIARSSTTNTRAWRVVVTVAPADVVDEELSKISITYLDGLNDNWQSAEFYKSSMRPVSQGVGSNEALQLALCLCFAPRRKPAAERFAPSLVVVD